MNRELSIGRCGGWALLVAMLFVTAILGQTVRNPKLAPADLEVARSVMREGSGSELVYAARIDAVTKGALDSLVVVYSKGTGAGKEYQALVVREGQKHRLLSEKSDKALPTGDRFLRIGLRHEAEKAPLLRLISAIGEVGTEERQRNLDFRFNGKEFELVGQSIVTPAR